MDTIPANIVREQPRIKELFQLVVENYKDKKIEHAVIYLSELLLLLRDATHCIPSTHKNTTISTETQEILAYISNNFDTIKTIDQVASHFYFSKNYLFLFLRKRALPLLNF